MKFLDKYNIKLENEKNIWTALTHTSYANEHNVDSYERLEYLGDAVLELIVSEYLYNQFHLPEGVMTKTRANYVCENALYEYAKIVGFIPYIKLGHGIDKPNETIIADVFEAILGAIYLEKGFLVSKEYILKIIKPFIDNHEIFLGDYKSLLQEVTQMNKNTLDYVLISESGPSHDKVFKIEVRIDNIVYGTGTGKSKKEAEQNAARDAYRKCAKR